MCHIWGPLAQPKDRNEAPGTRCACGWDTIGGNLGKKSPHLKSVQCFTLSCRKSLMEGELEKVLNHIFPINAENETKSACPLSWAVFSQNAFFAADFAILFSHGVKASASCSRFKIQQQNSHFPCGKRMSAQLLFQESRNVCEGRILTNLDSAASTREEKGYFPSVKTTCPEMCFNFLTKWTRRE